MFSQYVVIHARSFSHHAESVPSLWVDYKLYEFNWITSREPFQLLSWAAHRINNVKEQNGLDFEAVHK